MLTQDRFHILYTGLVRHARVLSKTTDEPLSIRADTIGRIHITWKNGKIVTNNPAHTNERDQFNRMLTDVKAMIIGY